MCRIEGALFVPHWRSQKCYQLKSHASWLTSLIYFCHSPICSYKIFQWGSIGLCKHIISDFINNKRLHRDLCLAVSMSTVRCNIAHSWRTCYIAIKRQREHIYVLLLPCNLNNFTIPLLFVSQKSTKVRAQSISM